MTVYVDDSKDRYGQMLMCHMAADTLDELHTMADKIGIRRRWFENNPRHPHYNICQEKRFLAIKSGAVAITKREMVELTRKNRKAVVK